MKFWDFWNKQYIQRERIDKDTTKWAMGLIRHTPGENSRGIGFIQLLIGFGQRQAFGFHGCNDIIVL